jgi:hypothetical protein
MKEQNQRPFGYIVFACLLLAILLITWPLNGCSVHKDISKGKTSVDSSYIYELEQNTRLLQLEVDRLNTKISTMEYTGVVFDNDCDSILKAALLKAGCNVDSINAVLAFYKSKVKYYADGTIEAEGNLKSLTHTKSKLEEIIKENRRTIDSLAAVKSKVEVKTEVKTEWKDKVVKRGISGFVWGLFILLIIAAFIAGFWLCWKYKDAIQEQLDAENS